MKFRFRTKMTKNIPGNFKNNFKYNQADMLCSFCPVNLTQEHLLICPKRSKFREDLDMNNLDDIITYIRGRPYRWQEIILMTMTRLTHFFHVWGQVGTAGLLEPGSNLVSLVYSTIVLCSIRPKYSI